MTRVNRTWIGFLVAPGLPAVVLYLFGRLKGYGSGAIVGPLLLAPAAYASALLLGLPIHLLIRKRGVRGIGSYVGIGLAIGLFSVVAMAVREAIVAWTWTPAHGYALSLWKYQGRYLLIAALYAALASAAFWVIAVGQRLPPQRTSRDVQ